MTSFTSPDTTAYLQELRESAGQVLAGIGTPAAEGTAWPLIVELGWLLAAVPEELEGLGLGVAGACTLHSALGRRLAEAPFLPAAMLLDAVCHSDALSRSQRADWVGRLSGGEMCTAALAEPVIHLQRNNAGVEMLNGVASAVLSADTAQHVLLWTAEADCVGVVKLDQTGVQRVATPAWDATRRVYEVQLDNVPLGDQTVLATGVAARKLIQRLQTLRDLSLAADSLGGAAALLDLTLEHLCTREQFGRPLAMFQALKHRCADMKALLAGAEALLQDSLVRVGDDLHDNAAVDAGRRAKQLACAAFSTIAEEALQLHGGIGMADEHPCHLFLKRAMLNEQLGTVERGYEMVIADSFLCSA